jgi:hypothetical protein
MDGGAPASPPPKRLARRTLLLRAGPHGAEAQTSRQLLATERAPRDQDLLSRRSLLAGMALLGAFGLGLLAGVAPGRSRAQGPETTAAATRTNASVLITSIWQGDPSEYQNRQEWQREHDSTCCPTSIATVLNAWHRAQDPTGRPFVHIRDVLHEAIRQKAYLSGAGTYWIGSVAPIAAHFGFRTIWGYDAISYLTYAAAVFDTAAGHQFFAALEDLLLGPSVPLLRTLKQEARANFLKETQNTTTREVPLELIQHIARRGFPVLVDLWSPWWPQGHMVTVYGGEPGSVYYADSLDASYAGAQIEMFRKVWVRDFAILYPRKMQFPRDLWQTLQRYPTVYTQ